MMKMEIQGGMLLKMTRKFKKLSKQDIEDVQSTSSWGGGNFGYFAKGELGTLVGKDQEGLFLFRVNPEGEVVEDSCGLPRRFKSLDVALQDSEGSLVLVQENDESKKVYEVSNGQAKRTETFPIPEEEIEKMDSRNYVLGDNQKHPFVQVKTKTGETRMFRKEGNSLLEISGNFDSWVKPGIFARKGERGVEFLRYEGDSLVPFFETQNGECAVGNAIKIDGEEFFPLRTTESDWSDERESHLYQFDGDSVIPVALPDLQERVKGFYTKKIFGEDALKAGDALFRKTNEGFEKASVLEDMLTGSFSTQGKDLLLGKYKSPDGAVLSLKPEAFASGKGELFNGQYQARLQEYVAKVDFYLEKRPELRTQFIENAWEFNPNGMSEEEVTQRIPVLMHMKAPLVRFMNDQHIAKLNQLTQNNFEDQERFLQFFNTVSSKLQDQDAFDMLFDKWCSLFSQSRGSAEKVIDALNKEYIRPNSKAPKKGAHYLHNADMATVPAELRPYAIFFTTPNSEIVREREEASVAEGRTLEAILDTNLSSLVATSMLNGNRLEGLASLSDYKPLLERTTQKINTENMNEEIIKTIKSQDATSYIWIRELIQNSRDAILKAGEDPKIKIDSYITGNNWVVSCHDPVGMNLREVVDYLIVPDRTTKAEDDSAGFFGQGFFTVFNDADEVHLKTSTGDGKVQHLTCACDYEQRGSDRVLTGIRVKELKQTEEDFKGTEVKRIKHVDSGSCSPELEGTFVSEAVYKYLGAIDPKQVNIAYNGQIVNAGLSRLSARDTSFGRLELLTDFEGLSRLTKERLYLNEINKEKYLRFVPEMVMPTLEGIGLTLDLPSSLTTTRTRNAISNEDDCLPELQKAIALEAIKSYAKLFVERGIDIPGLPRDYLYNEQYNMTIKEQAREDARALNEGKLENVDFTRYQGVDNRYDLVQLLTLVDVPIKRIGKDEDEYLSLQNLKYRIAAEARGQGGGLGGLAVSDKMRKDANEAVGEIRRRDEDDKKLPDSEMNKKLRADPYTQRFIDFTEETLGALDSEVTADTYYKDEARLCDFGFPRQLIFNLNHVYPGYVQALRNIVEGAPSQTARDNFVYRFLEEMGHEYTHFQDSGMWSHQEDRKMPESFRVRMQKNLNALLRDVNPGDVEKYFSKSD